MKAHSKKTSPKLTQKPELKQAPQQQQRPAPALLNKKREVILSIILLVSIVFTVFSTCLNHQFTNWDDPVYVTENFSIRQFDWPHVTKIFTSIVTKMYCPLTISSFAVEYHFFELNPFWYVLDNIFLHIAIVFLIFMLALQMGLNVGAAFLGALLFGIHPMHVESVAWITERKDVLYSVFYMLAVCSYWRYLTSRKLKWFWLSVAAGFLSVLSKGMAFSLPLVLLVCDWFYGRKIDKRVWLEKAAYLLYLIPLASVTVAEHARVPVNSLLEGSMIWIWSFTFNLKKFFWPYWFCPIYNVPFPTNFRHPDYDIAFFILVILIYVLVRFRKDPWLIFGFLFYVCSVIFLVRMKEESHVSTVGDRFMYLPSVGICLWIGKLLIDRLAQYKAIPWKKTFLTSLIVLLFIALGAKTYDQCSIWKNSVALWDKVLKHSPCSTAYHNRGLLFQDIGDFDTALMYYDKALKLLPEHYGVLYDTGLIYQDRKQYDKALKTYDKALAINPQSYKAHNNKGIIYLKLKKYDLALEECHKSTTINPLDGGLYALCADAHNYLGQYQQAMDNVVKGQKLGHMFSAKYLERLKGNLKRSAEKVALKENRKDPKTPAKESGKKIQTQ